MASIYSDDQRQSLMDSMTNPQSNAAKFLEQGAETGLSPDITMDILNKYATYSGNTGIGNIGGSRLVEALNEEYREKVDAPLQQEPKEALFGGLTAALQSLGTNVSSILPDVSEIQQTLPIEMGDIPGTGSNLIPDIPELDLSSTSTSAVDLAEEAVSSAASAPSVEQIGATIEADVSAPDMGLAEETRNPFAKGITESFEESAKFQKERPYLNQILKEFGKGIGTAAGSTNRKAVTPATRTQKAKFGKARQIRPNTIGMSEGGKTPEGSVLGRKMFIEGGEVDGPGGPREDMVPIWASNKEYVMSHNGVKRMGGGDFEQGIAALDTVNKNGVA